jgi:hypothetical protein
MILVGLLIWLVLGGLLAWLGLVVWAVRSAPIATDPDGYAD